MSLRTPLSRVLGAGSAKDGTDHWWMQRVTAVGLVIGCGWFLVSFAGLDTYGQAAVYSWINRPFNAVMLVFATLTLCWHSQLGLQVVIEDYVHGPVLKVFALISSKIVHVLLGIGGSLAILNVTLGSTA